MMSEHKLDRDDIYGLLRDALFEYSDLKRSPEMEIFAIEMEVAPGRVDSADPALLDEFNKVFPDKVTLRDGFSIAADYVERELLGLRHVDAARIVVADLRAAAERPEEISDILRNLVDGKRG